MPYPSSLAQTLWRLRLDPGGLDVPLVPLPKLRSFLETTCATARQIEAAAPSWPPPIRSFDRVFYAALCAFAIEDPELAMIDRFRRLLVELSEGLDQISNPEWSGHFDRGVAESLIQDAKRLFQELDTERTRLSKEAGEG